jgi:hypothetical protein
MPTKWKISVTHLVFPAIMQYEPELNIEGYELFHIADTISWFHFLKLFHFVIYYLPVLCE